MTKSILAILFIGVAIALFVMYIRPTYDATQGNRNKIATFDEALKKTREIQELKSDLLARRNVFTEENLQRLQKMLPDHVDNVRLVLDLDGIAANYGMRIQNVAIQETVGENNSETSILNGGELDNKPYQSLTLQFEVVATYDEFVVLLRDLESSLRIVDMTTLSIRPDSTADDLYTFGVALRTYWLP
tara:strand:+ start:3792 stop:4355 length:564 start_codon:yes stop_codon:yes gene_type:complete